MKTTRTLEIEQLLRGGLHTFKAIALMFGVNPSRIGQINKQMLHPVNRAAVRELWNVDGVLKQPSTAQGHGWIL